MRRRLDFTLIEMLAVMGIIAVLVAIGVGGYAYAMRNSQEAATKSLISRLEAALESNKAKYGFYPPGAGEYKFIVASPDFFETAPWSVNGVVQDNTSNKQNTAYMKDLEKILEVNGLGSRHLAKELDSAEDNDSYSLPTVTSGGTGKAYFLIDVWGLPFYYRSPGLVNRNSFDLISAGPDRKFTDKNLQWKNFSGQTYTREDFKECDDLTNF